MSGTLNVTGHQPDGHLLQTTIVDLFDEWAARTPDAIAAEWQNEQLTYAQLRNASIHVSSALLCAGVQLREHIPLLTAMSLEMLPAMIGVLRVGACLAPMDVAAWNPARIESAISELEPKVAVVTTACLNIRLPTITVNMQESWMREPLEHTDQLYCDLDARRRAFTVDYLAWILFTSGTTGKPKGVMVYHSGVHSYAVLEMMGIGATVKNLRCLLAFSVGFDGCASVIWTTLTKGRTLVLASSSDFPEVASTCDCVVLTPSMLSMLDPTGPYDRVRSIVLGAEGPSPELVRSWTRQSRKLYTTYGPTETTCNMTFGELTPGAEITLGDLLPEFKVVLVDEDLQEHDSQGEILIAGPGLAAGYLKRPDLTAQRFTTWQGERYYRTGDKARRAANGQYVWAGRADSIVKNRGFLINLESEVEPAILSFPEVRTAVAMKWKDKLIAYVQPAAVDVEVLRTSLYSGFDHFIVPDEIFALDAYPLLPSGKVDRAELRRRREALFEAGGEDPVPLESDSVFDALRRAFSECLHIPQDGLNALSSFTKLGGNSLSAIRMSGLLQKRGYAVSVIQILKLDNLKQLEEVIANSAETSQGSEDSDKDFGSSCEDARMTASQRLFLKRAIHNPGVCALIGTTTYVGDEDHRPSATELHTAFVLALSAHSIFKTRFDVSSLTLNSSGRLNLEWRDVSAAEQDRDRACAAAEARAWEDLESVTAAENEVPYFQVTCISNLEGKALAYVTRIHHVLIDVVSHTIISGDVDKALRGEKISPGPRIADFAHFMHAHERQNLGRAVKTFEKMVSQLPQTAVLQLPSPQTPLPHPAHEGLIRFEAPTGVPKAMLDQAARCLGLTSSTLVYAAWALFLSEMTGWDRVGFRISLSGRTVPWPDVQALVGCLIGGAPFSTAVPGNTTVHAWLASVHKAALDMLEFDGLTVALPGNFRSDLRMNTTNVLCFLDMAKPSTSNWKYTERQRHNYLLDWYIFEDEDGTVGTTFEIQASQVDSGWAREWAHVPSKMLASLVEATHATLVEELMQ